MSGPASLRLTRFSHQEEFEAYTGRMREEAAHRFELEQMLVREEASFQIPGFCFVCGKWTHFASSWEMSYEAEGRQQINWREHLHCSFCGLNNRMRAAIHLLA